MDESGNITKVQELATRVRESVQLVIVGKDRAIDLSMVALLCGGAHPRRGRTRYRQDHALQGPLPVPWLHIQAHPVHP